MKKILITLLLIFLSSCTWNYKNGDIQKNIDSQEVQELEKELVELEQKKAKETLEKIKLENEIASEVLENFLKSGTFNIKEEIARTKEKYNDNLGPILEYEHEKIEETIEKTATGETLSGTTIETQTGSVNNTEDIKLEKEENISVYSGEVKIISDKKNIAEKNDNQIQSEEIENKKKSEEVTYNTQEKKGRSGTYTMYIGISDNCKGGLEMTDLENNKKWLFENTCEKMIYNFELAVGGIKVFYNNQEGNKKEEFVSIK